MTRRRLIAALVFLGFGTGCFLSLGPLRRFAVSQFIEGELFFSSPIQVAGGILPIRKDVNGKGYFGASRNGGRTHRGIDLLSPVGDPVYASKSGRVIQANWQKGYGGVVKIAHPNGDLSVYAHLSRLFVREGEWIARSTPVGRIGKSGNASDSHTLPHLHFELRRNGVVIDPAKGPLDKNLKLILP